MTITDSDQQAADERLDQADPRDNTVTWWEIQVPDIEGGKAFYGAVFGWTFADFGEGFAICQGPDGATIGGLEQVDGGAAAGRHVRVYVQTADLEAALERVTGAGGTVLKPRALISEEFGWWALVADPAGLTIGLCTGRPGPESS